MMLVAYELKMTLQDVYDKMDRDELGWWLAFIKLKGKREEEAAKRAKTRNRGTAK